MVSGAKALATAAGRDSEEVDACDFGNEYEKAHG